MTKKRDYYRIALQIVAWVIFIGLCIEAGGFLTNTIISSFFNPEAAKKFWSQLDLSGLYQYSQSRFIMITTIMVIASILKALMFYFIVKVFYDRKVDISKPFNDVAAKFIQKIAYLSIGIGIFSIWGTKLVNNLVNEGVKIPAIQYLRIDGADVWLFMGVILLVLARVFKKGIELQNENDLTV